MVKPNQNLSPKLEAVLIRLGKAAPLNVTQAVKLPYLVDVVAMHVLGRRITEGTHQAWDYGVVTKEVWHFLDKCEAPSGFHLEPVSWSEEKRVVIDAEVQPSGLTPEEQRIVDFVAQEFAAIRAGDLGRLTKLMNPDISSWGSNRAASLGPDAHDRMTEDYQRMAAQAASATLDQLRHSSTKVDDIEDASRGDFLIQLAHELTTPLAALRNQIDFLEEVNHQGRHVRDSEEQFAFLREQADFIQYLVRDIQYQFRERVKIQTHYEFSAVDLRPTIERIKKLLLPTARMDRQIDIITGTRYMPPLFVDPRRMEQVVFNLLQNAVKYSRPGAGDIFLGYDVFEGHDAKGRSESWHRISFKNWGVGVEERDLPFIFEEFRRGSNVKGAPSGTGLGLAVAKRIVEAHGGRLSVVNLRNPTVFAVDLPEELARRPPPNANPTD